MNRYTNIKQIGEGTYGKVFRATNTITKKKVALKRMDIDKETGTQFTTIREIKFLKKLSKSTHIVGLYNTFIEHDFIFLEMEFMPYDLAGLIKTKYKFSEDQHKSLTYQLLEAMDYIHNQGLIHRDIKTGNILIDASGTLKLADFGLSRNTNELMSNRVCTLWYRAPELLLGCTKYDQKIDIWSVGCVIIEMITGSVAFNGINEIDQVKIVLKTLGSPKGVYQWSNLFKSDVYVKSQSWESIMFNVYGNHINKDMLSLLGKLIAVSPEDRITASEALKYGIMKNYYPKKIEIDAEEIHDYYSKDISKKKITDLYV